jgi:hypothetical protein
MRKTSFPHAVPGLKYKSLSLVLSSFHPSIQPAIQTTNQMILLSTYYAHQILGTVKTVQTRQPWD